MNFASLPCLLTTFFVLIFGVDGHTITCSAPSVAWGLPATVTCHFGRDIGQERRDFNINKYDQSGNLEATVLACYWNGHTVPTCEIRSGYSFNKHVNNDATLNIQNATEDTVGTYACQAIPAVKQDIVETCSFDLKDTTKPITQTSSHLYYEKEGEHTQMLPILLTVVIISVVVNFGLAIALTVTIQRLKKLEQESRTPRDGEVAERLPIQQNGDTNMESGTDERQPLLQDTPDSSQPNVRQEFESLRQVQERSLLQACRENRIQLVNWLVHSGAHVNCSDEKNGETPAHVAARFGYEMLLQFLLCSGADAEARNKKNFTPLHKACKYGREAVVDVLLAAGVDVNAETDNVTPVRLACQHDHTNVLNKLLRAGAIMDADITNNPP